MKLIGVRCLLILLPTLGLGCGSKTSVDQHPAADSGPDASPPDAGDDAPANKSFVAPDAGPEVAPDASMCAAGCLDQSFTESATDGGVAGSSDINEGFRYVAQTYTAGVSGVLRAISVGIGTTGQVSLRITVRDVVNGVPSGAALGSITIPASAPIGSVVALPDPIVQVAGQRYAIVADYPDAPPAGAGQSQGGWICVPADDYKGGALLDSSDGTNWQSFGDFDCQFATYVEPH